MYALKIRPQKAALGNGKQLELALTVTEMVHRNAQHVQHTEVQIRHWRAGWIPEMAPPFELTRTAAQQKSREILVRMKIAVADARSIDDHAVVQQGAIAVRS